MSDELIEKIARAIILNEHGERASWEEEGVGHQEMAKECARAALAAIEQSGTHVVVPVERTERALRGIIGKRLLYADVVGTTPDDDTVVRVWVRKEPVTLSHKSVAHVAQLLASEHEDYGSVEGRLQTVTERGGFHFVIYQVLWDEPVRCFVPEHLAQLAIGSFGQRVEVYGRIRYRKDGKAQSIEADDIIPFPPKESIPNFREIRGILRRAS